MLIDTVAPKGFAPLRAHPFDAGADLKAAETVEIPFNSIRKVPTGVHVAIPRGYVGLLFARSSLSDRKLMLANGVGVIDSGYTGEVMVPLLHAECWDYGEKAKVVEGERIAQLVVVKCELPEFYEVESLPETERGDGGFGSTNEKAAPKCLDADGVEIKPGDVVYAVGTGGMPLGNPKKVVCTVDYKGEFTFEFTSKGDNNRYVGIPSVYTHREPDSWEKLKSDVTTCKISMCGYFKRDWWQCDGCPADGDKCIEAALRDIVDRAERLAGVADE